MSQDSTHADASLERASQIKALSSRPWVRYGVPVVVLLLIAGGVIWWQISNRQVYIEHSAVTASTIDLSPMGSGALQQTYVHEGDMVNANTVVAQVGNELIKTKVAGKITYVADTIGMLMNRGTVVVSIINPNDLRVEGHLQEDKGLRDIHVGQIASFAVDAFGSRSYEGVVDEVGNAARSGDVVFNISDKRQEQEFDVKVRFDTALYPELKPGMSAKIWVQK